MQVNPTNLNSTVGTFCQYCNNRRQPSIIFVKEATGIRSCPKHINNAKRDCYLYCKEQKLIWIRKELIPEKLRRSSLIVRRSDGTLQANWFFCPIGKLSNDVEFFHEYEKFIKVGEHWTINVCREEDGGWVNKTMSIKQLLATNPHVDRMLEAVGMFVEDVFVQMKDYGGVLVG